jgi:hypothetical protein
MSEDGREAIEVLHHVRELLAEVVRTGDRLDRQGMLELVDRDLQELLRIVERMGRGEGA